MNYVCENIGVKLRETRTSTMGCSPRTEGSDEPILALKQLAQISQQEPRVVEASRITKILVPYS